MSPLPKRKHVWKIFGCDISDMVIYILGGLKLLQQKNMVEGFPPIQESKSSCERWILAKQQRDSFHKGVSYREKTPLELVHTDLMWSNVDPVTRRKLLLPNLHGWL
jgi:hypothetical protein